MMIIQWTAGAQHQPDQYDWTSWNFAPSAIVGSAIGSANLMLPMLTLSAGGVFTLIFVHQYKRRPVDDLSFSRRRLVCESTHRSRPPTCSEETNPAT